jgi:hypothetical protein
VTEQEQINRGAEAERLMQNPIYLEAIARVRDGIVQSMNQSALGDEKTHNRLVIAMQLLGRIEKNIKEVAETGKLTRIQVESKGIANIFRR